VKADEVGNYIVSTVHIGLELKAITGFSTLFETRIFPRKQGQENKYSSKAQYYGTPDEASAGHDRICNALKAGEEPELRERIS
jgi:hypothetical protein